MKIINDIAYGELLLNKMDAYLPENNGKTAIIHFHGGGLVEGDKSDHQYVAIAQDFANHGYAFFTVNYSLYPQNKFPQFLIDAAKAVGYIKNHQKEFGLNGQFIIAGQSAGAWISLMLAYDKSYLQQFGVDADDIQAWIIDSAQPTSHFNVIHYELGFDTKRQLINEYSPLYFVNENTKPKKILLIYYDNDIPCRPEQNKLFYANLKYFGLDKDVELKELPGTHCASSSFVDKNNHYPIVQISLDWLQK